MRSLCLMGLLLWRQHMCFLKLSCYVPLLALRMFMVQNMVEDMCIAGHDANMYETCTERTTVRSTTYNNLT